MWRIYGTCILSLKVVTDVLDLDLDYFLDFWTINNKKIKMKMKVIKKKIKIKMTN